MSSPSGPVNRTPTQSPPAAKPPAPKSPTPSPAAGTPKPPEKPPEKPAVKTLTAKPPVTPGVESQSTQESQTAPTRSVPTSQVSAPSPSGKSLPSLQDPQIALTKASVERSRIADPSGLPAAQFSTVRPASSGSGTVVIPAGMTPAQPSAVRLASNVSGTTVLPAGQPSSSASETSTVQGSEARLADSGTRSERSERSLAAIELGLDPAATQADIDAERLRLVNFSPNSPLAIADSIDRTAVNDRIAALKNEKPALTQDLKPLEMDPTKRTVEDVLADRYRIDPRGKTPAQLRQEAELRVAQLSGLDPNQLRNMSAADLEAANRKRSLAWLATMPESGIKLDPADPDFKNVTYAQMLQGYRDIYGLPKEATWADIQQTWMNVARNNNPELLKTAEMDRGQSEYFHYRQTSGLAQAEIKANPSAPSGQIYVLDGATFKTPEGKPLLDAKEQPIGFDLNQDGRVDVSHSRIVTELINDAIPQDRITLVNISSADGQKIDSIQLMSELQRLGTLSKTPGNVAAVNLSVQPFASNAEANSPTGERLTFDYLSKALGLPGLNADNIAQRQGEVRQKLNEITVAFGNKTRTDPFAFEVTGWNAAILSIETVTANKVPVYLAAGNQGPDAFNVYGLANGVTMVGATDPNRSLTGRPPVMASNSGENSMLSARVSGEALYTDTGMQAIDGNGQVTLNPRTGGRTGIDLNLDGRADFFLSDLSDNGGVVRGLDQLGFVQGTSFATPRALVEDFQRGRFRVD